MKFNAYFLMILSTFIVVSGNAYCDSTTQNSTSGEQTEFERRVKLRKEIKAEDSRTVDTVAPLQDNAQSKPIEPVLVQTPAAPASSQSLPGTSVTPQNISTVKPAIENPQTTVVQMPASDIPVGPTENRLEALRAARLKMEVINENKVIENLELSRVQDENNRLARILGKNQITAESNIGAPLIPPLPRDQTVVK